MFRCTVWTYVVDTSASYEQILRTFRVAGPELPHVTIL